MKGTLSGRATIASTTLSLGTIIGIAVGGAFVLAVILGAIACFCARRRHGQKRRIPEADENGPEDVLDIKDALSSIRPPDIAHRRRTSATPFIRLESFDNRGWIAHDPYFNPPTTKPRRYSSHKGFFKGSGMRDSWPLVTNIPLSIISNHNITPSQVAPPGYIVEDPKRPRRSSSLWAKKPGISQGSEPDPSSPTKSVKSANSSKSAPLLGSMSPKFDPQFPPVAAKRERSTTQRPKPYQRSTSETHLSTILRSTSQRLKAAQRNSLTRTLSTLGRAPVRRPSEKVPHPPVWAAAESREALIDKEYAEYLNNPLHSSFHNRTSSPVSLSPWPSRPLSRRTNSPTPDQESPDSLCNIDTPELLIPAPLSLPSKQGSPLAEKRHRMRISSGEAKELAVLIHKDSRASILAPGDQEKNSLSVPHRTSFTGDPFYSSVRFSKSGIPTSLVPGGRPLYICKATFGDETTSESPSSFSSPLGEVSHNVRTPPKESLAQESTQNQKLNPFQWSPQEAMQTRATQTSPKHTNAKRKGHKRSNVMRISNISRPASMVEVVPEEPDDKSTLKFFMPRNLPAHVSDSETSPSRRSSRGSGIRPPSSAVFNPSLNMSKLRPESETDSAIFVRQSKELLSPTLSGNYYESSGCSEHEFFATNKLDYNRNAREYSSELQAYSTYQLQHELQQRLLGTQEKLFSFPPPIISTTPPPSRPLPTITATMTSLRSGPAMPILTVPVPSHLTGPRAEPKKVARSLELSVSTMPSTISMLRRMNSEISNHSPGSSPVTSPNFPGSFSSLNNISERTSKSIRGTKNYLSLGGNNSLLPRSNNRNSRDSHKISKGRRKNQRGDFELLYDDSDDEREESMFTDKNMLTPVKEVSSPAITTSSINKNQQVSYLKFPTLNRERSTQPTPGGSPKHKPQFQLKSPTPQSSPMENFRVQLSSAASQIDSKDCEHKNHQSPVYVIPLKNPKRFSAPTPTPAPTSHVIRQESRIEYPSPVTPVSALEMGISGLRLVKKRKGGVNLDSPGLYDDEGFLRGSPDRERLLRIMDNKKLREDLKRGKE